MYEALVDRIRSGLRLTVALLLALTLLVSLAVTPAEAQVVSQETEQEADSGDVDQSFEVTGDGDNSNQCVNVNGSANTGNLQSSTSFTQYNSRIEEFEQEDISNDLTVGGDSTVTCDQQVNQAAAAGASEGYCTWSGWWCYWSTDGSWWYWDGATWWDVSYSPYTTVSNVATGTLDAASGLTPLIILGTLAAAGTGGLLFRRNRRRG